MATDLRQPAGRVVGCIRCGKPAALVGDLLPADQLCPFCREDDCPGVMRQYLLERTHRTKMRAEVDQSDWPKPEFLEPKK